MGQGDGRGQGGGGGGRRVRRGRGRGGLGRLRRAAAAPAAARASGHVHHVELRPLPQVGLHHPPPLLARMRAVAATHLAASIPAATSTKPFAAAAASNAVCAATAIALAAASVAIARAASTSVVSAQCAAAAARAAWRPDHALLLFSFASSAATHALAGAIHAATNAGQGAPHHGRDGRVFHRRASAARDDLLWRARHVGHCGGGYAAALKPRIVLEVAEGRTGGSCGWSRAWCRRRITRKARTEDEEAQQRAAGCG